MTQDKDFGANGIRVVITDAVTGEQLADRQVKNDYVLICAGNHYLKSHQIMGTTHMLAVTREKTGTKGAP